MTKPLISIIDKSKEIQAVKNKYGPKFYHNPDALKAAADIWGIEHNDHGVALNRQKETLVEFNSCKATVSLVQTANNHWLMGLSVESAYNGFGYAPSIWDVTGFVTYWDARLCAVEKSIAFFKKVTLSSDSCNSDQNRYNASKAMVMLQGERTPQISLFDGGLIDRSL